MEIRTVVRISVRNLVEFLLRSGDIRSGGRVDAEVMQMGSRIHRKIQKNMGPAYRAEVPLSADFEFDDFVLRVEGRADGIQGDEMIDEIKGVLVDLDTIEEPVPVHLAQAKCYAYIFGIQNAKESMCVQLTYCQMETEEIRRFMNIYTIGELERWFTDLVNEYAKWARLKLDHVKVRTESVKELQFPFTYREGQREIATSVYKTILRGKKLFVQAPTGVGKTMAAVFPAVKAMGEGLADKIFYLTARTITRTVAQQAFDTLKERGAKISVITLTAKEKICFGEMQCDPDQCEYAKGHYDRVNDAMYDLLTHEQEISRSTVEEYARKWSVCPFEFALDVSEWVDAVICDYNYVFDPEAHLRRFLSEGVNGDYLFLVDEAHNLVDRGRDMYSASLFKGDFLAVKRLVGGMDKRLAKRLDECNKILLAMKKECENVEVLSSISPLYMKLLNVMSAAEAFMDENVYHELEKEQSDEFLNLYFRIRSFIDVYERMDDNYLIYSEFLADGEFMVKLLCVNPAERLKEYLDKGVSTVFFSATFLPIGYYKMLLDTDKDDYAVYVNSPFSKEKRRIVAVTDVSARYTQRGEEMYRRYAKVILETVGKHEGNYIAYFPSYRFMKEVFELFEAPGNMRVIMQAQGMNEGDREEFLREFEDKHEGSLVAFCVLGGIFAEGIDLTAERLIGTFIVGTGLPQICSERELIRSFFDAREMQGFDYAYRYPGMNKVLQAAGRVIRTEEDEGVIFLLDERFRERNARDIFPREWDDVIYARAKDAPEISKEFWGRKSE